MSGIEIAAGFVAVLSGGTSIGCVVRAYLPSRSTIEGTDRMGIVLTASQPPAEQEPVPGDLSALLDQIDRTGR
jgi:hypothetical protein